MMEITAAFLGSKMMVTIMDEGENWKLVAMDRIKEYQ
jgi:hypothetical protein